MEELARKFETFGNSFEEYKKTNDKRLLEIAGKGMADPLTEEKLKKNETDLVELKAQIKEMTARIEREAKDAKVVDAGVAEKTEKYEGMGFKNILGKDDKPVFFDDNGNYSEKKEKEHRAKLLHYFRTEDKTTHSELRQIKSLIAGNDAQGGYVTMAPMQMELVQNVIEETSPMHALVNIIRLSVPKYERPVTDGRVGASRVGEIAARAVTTNMEFKQLSCEPGELYAMPIVSQTLLEDSTFDLERYLIQRIANEFMLTEATEMISNDGVDGGAHGILSYASGTSFGQIQQVVSGSAATINDADEVKDLVSKMKAYWRQGSSFIAGRLTYNEIFKLKDTTNQYLWQPSLEKGVPNMLLGYPIHEAEDMPVLAANSLSLAFGNWKAAYAFVERIGMSVLRDPYTNKPYVQFYARKRSGGIVEIHEAIKIMKCSV